MIINTALSFGVVLAVSIGGWALFWPSVPWTGVLIAAVTVSIVGPIVFYPWSMSIWAAIELSHHRLEPEERAEAARRVAGDDPPSQ